MPLYEVRTITDLQRLEEILGPVSLKRTYAGYRTTAGQIPVVVGVNAPVRVIYDEADKSAMFHFSVSPRRE